jgi:hypothetical protein
MPPRTLYGPLGLTKGQHWYVARDRLNAVIEAWLLVSGSDPKRVVAAMLERIDAGSKLGEFSSRGGSFFCTRGVERCQAGIEAADPARPIRYGAAHLTESPGHEG